MASRSFHEDVLGLEKQRVDLFAVIAIGASGAPTLSRGARKGIQSVVRNSAGLYTITLTDAYAALIGASVAIVQPVAANLQAVVVSSSLGAATKTIVIRTQAGAVATDPASGDQLLVQVCLANGSL